MEEREKEDLYIPTYVTAQHEYFPGFGKKNYISQSLCQHL